MLKIYLAGAITGVSYGDATEWRNGIYKAFVTSKTIQVVDPMRQKGYLSKEEAIASIYPNTITSGAKAVYRRDRFDVQRCDVLLVNFDVNNGHPSIGTLVEIGMADAWGKLILIISKNVIIHPFLTENSILLPTVDEAIEFIRGL